VKETQDNQLSALSASVQGRVQGVGFRYACIQEASRLGLTGWVRNTPLGSVEVWAEGGQKKLEQFLQWLRRGPPQARVTAVDWNMRPPAGTHQDFSAAY
jgi:acylphosphatase